MTKICVRRVLRGDSALLFVRSQQRLSGRPTQAPPPTLTQPGSLEAGFTWRDASGLDAGFGFEGNAPPQLDLRIEIAYRGFGRRHRRGRLQNRCTDHS